MALDGVLLNGLAKELESELLGGRVDKIQQPEMDEIHLTIRCKGKNHRLLLSASASHPRIHLTGQIKSNPMVPPMFCMVLRKHLSGGRLVSIYQPGMERILEIGFEVIDEIGDLSRKNLVIEIMGRHSNIILTDPNGIILDSIKHIDSTISRVREVLPGKIYTYPPSQGKTDPRIAKANDITLMLLSSEPGSRAVNVLTKSYTGISKVTAEEIFHRAQSLQGITKVKEEQIETKDKNSYMADAKEMNEGEADHIATAFQSFFQQVMNNVFQPSLLIDVAGKPKDILPMAYTIYHPAYIKTYPSFSNALDDFFLVRDQIERMKQRTSHLSRVIKNNLDRCHKKLTLQMDELEKAKNAKQHQLFGELITSNIYQIPKGADEVALVNYYEPDTPMVVIPLDPFKTPAQNAQNYFRQYNKFKTVQEKQSRFMQETRHEIDYLESISQHLSMCTNDSDILEIRQELTQTGYLREQPKKKKMKNLQPVSKPHHFLSSDGLDIFVGKNNIQNDQLTLKTALPSDLWLHTKTIQGSHVIVKTGGQTVPEATLREAANLAAFYSKGRSSANVPVDYCPRKNVKKPGGAKPGMVIYEQYKTVYVTPSEEVISSLKKL